MSAETALLAVCFWASVFRPVFCCFITIFMHAQADPADGDAIIINGEIIFIGEMPCVARVQVNKGSDVFPSAVFIDRAGIMGGIEQKFFNA